MKLIKAVPAAQKIIGIQKVSQGGIVTTPSVINVANSIKHMKPTVSNLLMASRNVAVKTNNVSVQNPVSILSSQASIVSNQNGSGTLLSTNNLGAITSVCSQVIPSGLHLLSQTIEKQAANVPLIKTITENTHTTDIQLPSGINPYVKPDSNGIIDFKESTPPPPLQSPSKLQLIPQPIVPISQTFTSRLSISTNSLCSDPSTYTCTMPQHLFDGEDSDDNKPPTLEMEPPMLEMEAPILRLETEGDVASIKSDPDSLSNHSLALLPMSMSSAKSEQELPVYPMSSSGLEVTQTVIQTTSYNSFTGTGKGGRRRKAKTEGTKENKRTSLTDTEDEAEHSPAKKVRKMVL